MDQIFFRNYKKNLFELYWQTFGIFFVHIIPHINLKIENRDLIKDEKKNGILLIFGETSTQNLSLENNFIKAELQFGSKWEKISIPWDAILAFYDKKQTSITQLATFTENLDLEKKPRNSNKIIQVNFKKAKK